MESYEDKIRRRLTEFYQEFDKVCRDCGRDLTGIKVLFATKYLDSEQLASFIRLYHQLRGEIVFIGENKVQAAQQKFQYMDSERPELKGKYYRIMIGNLQKNKINKALELFDEIWGVDSIGILNDLNMRAKARKVPVFLEINVSGEASKHGIGRLEAPEVITYVSKLQNLRLKGLMTMAPETLDKDYIKKVFAELRTLADKYNLKTSMGMSSDWKEAVEAGSDILRLGSRIFR